MVHNIKPYNLENMDNAPRMIRIARVISLDFSTFSFVDGFLDEQRDLTSFSSSMIYDFWSISKIFLLYSSYFMLGLGLNFK